MTKEPIWYNTTFMYRRIKSFQLHILTPTPQILSVSVPENVK